MEVFGLTIVTGDRSVGIVAVVSKGLEQRQRQLQLKMELWNLSWEAIALYRRKDGVELKENVVGTSPYQDIWNKLNRFDF